MTTMTLLSPRGQVVIPAGVRRALGWRSGDRLAVEVSSASTGIVTLSRPAREGADALLARGYAWFAQDRGDLVAALHESRRRARAQERRRP
jgi:AbrB family looped-hinge helix DNA binding protein